MNTKKIGFSSYLCSEFLPGSSGEDYTNDGDIHNFPTDHKSQHSAYGSNNKRDPSSHPTHIRLVAPCDHNSKTQEAPTSSLGLPVDISNRSRSRKDRRRRVLNFLRVPFALEYVLLNYFLIFSLHYFIYS